MSLSLSKLTLTQFRNYTAARVDIDHNMVILTGANGAGKTNLLEAVSLLTPGKGIRNAGLSDMRHKNAHASEFWAVAAEFQTDTGMLHIGTGEDRQKRKRIIRINGENAKSQAALAEHTSAIWLTPQMDGLFLDSPSARRRFLDRLCFNFDPAHVGRSHKLDKAVRERSKILRNHGAHADTLWLDTLEKTIADCSVAISAARQNMIERLQIACQKLNQSDAVFPIPEMQVQGWLEDALANQPAIKVEENMRQSLTDARQIDSQIGGASFGAHKSDWQVHHHAQNMPAAQCSTGEQKALLISIMLANAHISQAENGFTPLLLLDEIVAHLDATRRAALFDILNEMQAQTWISGTDLSLFDTLHKQAQFLTVENGAIRQHR